jgi:aspartate-semialdehyde dehydrogenase
MSQEFGKAKLRVGILGATGTVGQRFIELLESHPQFEITALAGSDRSQGKIYREACAWRLPSQLPERIANLPVSAPRPELDCDLVFSSLPSDVAREAETEFARAGYPVISNSSAFRMAEGVPLLVPEINHEHLALLDNRGKDERGFIVTNPNCSTIMIALALAPLHQKFGVEAVIVTTMQAISGAGYPGVPSLDVADNVLPFIKDEEEKIESETLKILGQLEGGDDARIAAAKFPVSAQCNRVAVTDGHLAAVRVKLASRPTIDEVRSTLDEYVSLPQELKLHSAPQRPIIVRDEPDRPQPRLDRDAGKGMSVTVGRLMPDTVLDFRFVCLSHNTIRGAAGAAILNAELLIATNRLMPFSC